MPNILIIITKALM